MPKLIFSSWLGYLIWKRHNPNTWHRWLWCVMTRRTFIETEERKNAKQDEKGKDPRG